MKNILSILSLSLVILIGYSEESISQVNEANPETREFIEQQVFMKAKMLLRSLDAIESKQSKVFDNATLVNREYVRNIANNVDIISLPCVRHASALLTKFSIAGLSEFDAEDLAGVKNNANTIAVADAINDFFIFFEEEMRRCQAAHSDTADEVNVNR